MWNQVGLTVNMKKSKIVTGDEMSILLSKTKPEPLELILVKEYLGVPLQISKNYSQVAFSESKTRTIKAEMYTGSPR